MAIHWNQDSLFLKFVLKMVGCDFHHISSTNVIQWVGGISWTSWVFFTDCLATAKDNCCVWTRRSVS